MQNLLLDTVGSLMKGDNLATMTKLIDADSEGAAKKGIVAGASALMATMAQQAQTPEGAAGLQQVMSNLDPGLDNNVSGYLQNPASAKGGELLQTLLGNNATGLMSKVSQACKLSPDSVGRLMPALAPLMMGTVSQAVKSEGLGVADLPKYFADQAGFMKTLTPGLMGFLERIDANDDGSIMDDLGRLTDRIFGGKK